MSDDNHMSGYIVSLQKERSALQSDVQETKRLRQAGLSRLDDLRAEQCLLQHQLAQVKARRELADKVAQLLKQVAQRKKRLRLERRRVVVETEARATTSIDGITLHQQQHHQQQQQQKTTDSCSCEETDLSEFEDLDDQSFEECIAKVCVSAESQTMRVSSSSSGTMKSSASNNNTPSSNVDKSLSAAATMDSRQLSLVEQQKATKSPLRSTRKEPASAQQHRERKMDCV